jgi:hypothetical protein
MMNSKYPSPDGYIIDNFDHFRVSRQVLVGPYDMSVVDGTLAIKYKTAFIDTHDLYAQAKVSVIL